MSLHKTFDKDGKVTEIMATGKDAVLAEAAPDLLAACEEAVDWLKYMDCCGCRLELIEQAIAKAK